MQWSTNSRLPSWIAQTSFLHAGAPWRVSELEPYLLVSELNPLPASVMDVIHLPGPGARGFIGITLGLSCTEVSVPDRTILAQLSVDTSVGYGLGGWSSIPGMSKKYSVLLSVPTGSGTHPVSHQVGAGSSLPGNRALGAWSWPLTTI
jgi:hypothetical protein